MQAVPPLGPYAPAYLMVLEVAVADRDAIWRLWATSIGESQKKALEIWSKLLPSSSENFFEGELLTYYWALVESEHLTIGQQLTIDMSGLS